MALDNVLSVAVLPAGASAIMAHGISDIYGSLKPNFIRPDRATAIGVSACDATSVTFTNYGNQTESAFFHVSRDHSIQQAGKAGVAGAYASEIFLNQFDYHIQHDTLGSRQEYIK